MIIASIFPLSVKITPVLESDVRTSTDNLLWLYLWDVSRLSHAWPGLIVLQTSGLVRGLFCSPTIRFDWSETTQWLRDPVHNHAPLLSPALKFYPTTWSWNKIRIRSAWTDQTWKMRALSESDPRRLQRAQYQSNWKRTRITALASHSRVKHFYERESILDFSSSQHPALPHSSSTQHSKRERGTIERL